MLYKLPHCITCMQLNVTVFGHKQHYCILIETLSSQCPILEDFVTYLHYCSQKFITFHISSLKNIKMIETVCSQIF